MKTKKKIALFTSIQGHLSMAQAIKQNLDQNYKISIFQERDFFFNLYLPIYRFLPRSAGMAFRATSGEKTTSLVLKFFKEKYENKIKKFYLKYQPDLCINTHFYFSPALEKLTFVDKTPFINVLSDPKTIHPLLLSANASVNLAFDEDAIKTCKKINNKANCVNTGWFVRDEFEKEYEKKQVRKKLKLEDKLTIFVVSGSDGTTMIAKIIPALVSNSNTVQIIIACGNNKTLLKSINTLKKILSKTKMNNSIITLPFTNKMHLYMQAADLVIGKAGPNTLFESVATLTPFFAITHITGQEDGNLEIIEKYKLGFIEENPLKASKLLLNIINNPKQLASFLPHLKKMKKHNYQAKEKLQKMISSLLK